MKKKMWIGALVAVVAVAGFVWSLMGASETAPATTVPRAEVPQERTERGWNNMHLVFVEEYLQFGKMEQAHYEAWYSDRGHCKAVKRSKRHT